MSANLAGFDASEVEPSTAQDVTPVPNGKYTAIITDSEMKDTKAGTGSYLALEFQIIDGEFAKRRLWANLNLDNPNATAVKIAKADLSAICHAVDIIKPSNSAELHNKPLILTVKVIKRKDNGELKNEIKGYASAKDSGSHENAATEEKAPWEK